MQSLGYIPEVISASSVTTDKINQKPTSSMYVGHLPLNHMLQNNSATAPFSLPILRVDANEPLMIPANSVIRRIDYVFHTLPDSTNHTATISLGVRNNLTAFKAAKVVTAFENATEGAVLTSDIYAYQPYTVGAVDESILLTLGVEDISTVSTIIVYVYCDAV